ncbi:MAG TPA: hypothetical protein DDY58_06480 [Terrisporobacter glycolicus]|uniref:hypothetical protein n=1 Tax=Terrisporobacter TaxID=1505652 RepID=UPI000E89C78F|nr:MULTISPECIES: hypothetical protein [Terrisporobacter]HBI92095.1 hypothetical protein [Terrisporobacter hibernicus]
MLEKFFKSLNPMDMLSKWLKEIGKDVILSSYWICLIGGIIGLLLYVFGSKKGKDAAMLSPIIYVIIRILGAVILGVK